MARGQWAVSSGQSKTGDHSVTTSHRPLTTSHCLSVGRGRSCGIGARILALSKGRVPEPAGGHDLGIDVRQGRGGVLGLRLPFHNGRNAVVSNAEATGCGAFQKSGFGTSDRDLLAGPVASVGIGVSARVCCRLDVGRRLGAWRWGRAHHGLARSGRDRGRCGRSWHVRSCSLRNRAGLFDCRG